MKLVQLTLAALLASACAVATAQVNPFAPPAAPAPTPVATTAAPPVAAPEPPPPAKPQWEEEVRASRIGTVNGVRVYRGSNTYMFEKAKDVDVIRRLVVPSSNDSSEAPDVKAPRASGAPASASTSSPAAPPKALPSMVGKPAPRK